MILCSIFLVFFSWSLVHDAGAVLSDETDKLALLEFKSQMTEDSLGVTDSWNDSVNFCSWKGIQCGQKHQRVIMLDLKGQRLAGIISPYLGNLSFLHTLDLAENSFHGPIPSELGRLFRLRNLNLSSNILQGGIPINLSQCSNLKYLILDHNNHTKEIPSELELLSKLEILNLGNNKLSGRFPASLGNLSSLQEVSIAFNNLEGEIPDAVGLLTNLTMLNVAANNFSGVFPPSVYNLSSLKLLSMRVNNFHGKLRTDIGLLFPNMEKLHLSANWLKGNIPASLSNATNLIQLNLGFNNFTGNIPSGFQKLKNLMWLTAPQNILGNNAPGDLNFLTSLANCSMLQYLDIADNHFGGEFPSSVANLSTKLRWLNFYTNNIHGSVPAGFANLVGLNALGMAKNFLTGNIPASLGTLPNLKELWLASNQLSGEIPSSLGNLTQLLYLHLDDNKLEGNIPANFGNFQYLQEILLSYNKLNGKIPKGLMSLASLSRTLNLSHNYLTGSITAEVGNLNVLDTLDVSYNRLSGEIPIELGRCLALDGLYMQGNLLEGPIPDLRRLTGLQYIDLSSNNLYGDFPRYFSNFSSLVNLNLSNNNLEGEVPTNGIFKNASAVEVNDNKHLCGGIKELQLHSCPEQIPLKRKKHIALKFILVIVIVTSFLALASSLTLLHCMKIIKTQPNSRPSTGEFYPKMSYKELHDATGGFSSLNLIGSGNFGTVYKGILVADPNETTVAIKVLNLQKKGASKSFSSECQALGNIRHRNLLKVLTACSSTDFQGNDFKALVYQFMPNGSLENWLHPEAQDDAQVQRLNLLQRINIAVDVGSALHYLHHQCKVPVVHCDLKPSNVLLDNDLTGHVGDFGMARLLLRFTKDANSNQFSSLGVKGTIGYAAPEYGIGGMVSIQGDVYSYGILLLEMFTGKRPTDEPFRDNFDLYTYVQMSIQEQVMDIVDQSALNKDDDELTAKNGKTIDNGFKSEQIQCLISSVFQVGLACAAKSPQDRISMREAISELFSIRDRFQGAVSRKHQQSHFI